MNYIEPEVFWCSYCGKNIWVQAYPNIQPEHLICEKCKLEKRYENKNHQDSAAKED